MQKTKITVFFRDNVAENQSGNKVVYLSSVPDPILPQSNMILISHDEGTAIFPLDVILFIEAGPVEVDD